MRLKERIGNYVVSHKKSPISRVLVVVNQVLFHWDNKCRMTHPGTEDRDLVYYVIRPDGVSQGLLSLWFRVARSIDYSMEKGYIPYVDFSAEYKDYCQYYVDRPVNGTTNAWEYYFKQVSDVTKEQLSSKRNVLLSGWTWKHQERRYLSSDVAKTITVQDYVQDLVDKNATENFSGDKILGVFLRGTDYVSIKPKDHPIQPTIDEMIAKVKEVISTYEIDKIYFVTEDSSYYKAFNEAFPGMVFSVYNHDVNYTEGRLLQKSFDDDPYQRGLEYLVRILLLNHCDYLVCSQASGSQFAQLVREKDPVYEYWFDLGNY